MAEHLALSNDPFVPSERDVGVINNLPPELLSRIFEIGYEDDSEASESDEDYVVAYNFNWDDEDTDGKDISDHTYPISLPPFPIIVSHVCRHWRNVAFSTPYLWTTIEVTPGLVTKAPYELQSTLLERSKILPIDIYINFGLHEHAGSVEELSHADVECLASMLTSHIHRWRTLHVSFSHHYEAVGFLGALSDSSITAAPQLTTLELHYEGIDSVMYPSMKHFTLFGGSAALLTRLVLWGVHVDWNQTWIASAFNLVELELAHHSDDNRPSWGQFAAILCGASVLEKLTLCQSGPAGDPAEWFIEPTSAPVRLPRLTDFVLALHTPLRATGLIHTLHLPALESLVLQFERGDYADFVLELARPVTSSYLVHEEPRSLLSGLASLKIIKLPCRSESIRKLYSELVNLTSLILSMPWHLSRLHLEVLCTPCTLAGQSDIWLPRLLELYVSGTSGSILRKLVERRKAVGVPLTSLCVDKYCDVNKEDVAWLKGNLETFLLLERV